MEKSCFFLIYLLVFLDVFIKYIYSYYHYYACITSCYIYFIIDTIEILEKKKNFFFKLIFICSFWCYINKYYEETLKLFFFFLLYIFRNHERNRKIEREKEKNLVKFLF